MIISHIHDYTKIPFAELSLSSGGPFGKLLEDLDSTLFDYDIRPNSTLHCQVSSESSASESSEGSAGSALQGSDRWNRH